MKELFKSNTRLVYCFVLATAPISYVKNQSINSYKDSIIFVYIFLKFSGFFRLGSAAR